MIRFCLRCIVPLVALLQASSSLCAEQPEMVGLANSNVAERFATTKEPGVRVVILHLCDSEEVSAVDQRALELRSARFFVYESRSETPLQAMYRERLVQHGVTAIDVTPLPRQKIAIQPPRPQVPFLSLLAYLQAAP